MLPVVTEVAAEHRMYLPLVALLAADGRRVLAGVRRWAAHARTWTAPVVALVVVAALAIAGCTMLTRARNVQYQDEEGIWARHRREAARRTRGRSATSPC